MSRPPRVVMLAPHLDRVGGYELQALSLAGALSRRGISVWLVTDNLGNRAPREERGGVVIYRLSFPQSPWWRQPRWPWAMSSREDDLAVFLRQHAARYDAVHAAAFCPPCDVGMQVAQHLGKPSLVKVATEGDPTEIATGSPELRAIWARLLHADHLVCISGAIAEEFTALGVPPTKLVRIPNGVDTATYRPPTPEERRTLRRAIGLAEDAVAFVSVGRLAQRKGIDVLLRAWHALPDDGRAVLLLVGEGEEGERLRALATELGLDGRVRFLGERHDVAAVLRTADAFVFSSRREGLSNAVLEAMSTGLPIVATRIGGNVDLIGDDAYGLLCAPDDPVGLATGMLRLRSDASLRRHFGEAARARILDAYALERIVDQLLPLYRITLPPAAPAARAGRAA